MGDVAVNMNVAEDVAVSLDVSSDIAVSLNPTSDIAVNFPSIYWDGLNIVPSASSVFKTDGTAYWFGVDYVITWDGTNKWMVATISAASQRLQSLGSVITIGKRYHHKLMAKSPTMTTQILTGMGSFYDNLEIIQNPPLSTSWKTYEFKGDAKFVRMYICISNESNGEAVYIDNIQVVDIS